MGRVPGAGHPRRHAPRRVGQVRNGLLHPGERSPLLDYLAATANRTGDYLTGREGALREWILSRPDNSVDPLALYQASLALHGGNIWNAVLAAHQLLRNHARWWATERYHFRSSREEQEALFNKLVDIRGELSERGDGFHGDHAGSWYRVWGAMLFRLGFVADATFAARASGQELDAGARLIFRMDDLDDGRHLRCQRDGQGGGGGGRLRGPSCRGFGGLGGRHVDDAAAVGRRARHAGAVAGRLPGAALPEAGAAAAAPAPARAAPPKVARATSRSADSPL